MNLFLEVRVPNQEFRISVKLNSQHPIMVTKIELFKNPECHQVKKESLLSRGLCQNKKRLPACLSPLNFLPETV